MNKQGPLKAILDKGGLGNISTDCVPAVFLKGMTILGLQCVLRFFFHDSNHHRSTPLRKERPDQVKMWPNINFMLKSIW